jgi:hypothetical protein
VKISLSQPQLAKRYSTVVRTVLRMRRDGRLPEPDFYIGPFPRWWEESLEQHERAALRAPPSKTIGTRTKAD